MDKAIKEYVESCQHCQEDKARGHKCYGLLSPTETPYKPWDDISMDFITDLPTSEGHTEIWVVIDRFTKIAHFIPLHKEKKKAPDLAKIFVKEICRLHGVPKSIISDRDTRFTSDFWKQFLEILDVTGAPRSGTRLVGAAMEIYSTGN